MSVEQIKKYAEELKPVKATESLSDNKLFIGQMNNLLTLVLRSYNEAIQERNVHVMELRKARRKLIKYKLRLMCMENEIDLDLPIQYEEKNDKLKILKEYQISYKTDN